MPTGDEAADEGRVGRWLAGLPVEAEEPLLLSWDALLAVETVWRLFLRRWSDFWYPSSDALDVIPVAGVWALRASDFGRFDWTPGGAVGG